MRIQGRTTNLTIIKKLAIMSQSEALAFLTAAVFLCSCSGLASVWDRANTPVLAVAVVASLGRVLEHRLAVVYHLS